MKKMITLFTIVVLIALLVVGSAMAQGGEIEPEPEPGEGLPGEVEAEPEAAEAAAGDADAEEAPSGTAARINFETSSGHAAKRGHYSIQVAGGAEIASWYALDGWLDSGWINDLEIGAETVLVDVLYYPGPETEPTKMRILNPAPGTGKGWLGRGMEHSLEVAWPDQPVEGFDTESVDSEL